MLAIAVMVGYAAACAVVFALVVLAALPFRLVRRTREPLVASALACGTLLTIGVCVNGVPDRFDRSLGFYVVAFLVSVRFYNWRDAKLMRSAHDVRTAVGLAGALPAGASDASGKLDDSGGVPEVQV